jgi:hypothetical protein
MPQIKVEPRLYRLLQNIKTQLTPVTAEEELDISEGRGLGKIADSLVDQIISIGDERGTPLVRIENKFFIYDNDEQLPLPSKALQEFLLWSAKAIGLGSEIYTDIPFRQMMFGRAWREMHEYPA